jgi:TPP-dependent pyruvate/acetoin dehydrogenase alpha subunit
LLRLGAAEGDLVNIERAVSHRVDEATEYAKAGALPTADVLEADVWSDGGAAWRN